MPTEPAGNHPRVEHLFEQLLALSRDAHAHRQHEVAYHALIAAMHAAHDTTDVPGLLVIVNEARAQIGWIDGHEPEHRLSTTSAGRHNHPGVYAILARQADTIARLIAGGK